MDSSAYRTSALLVLAFVAAMVLAFGGLVAEAVGDSFDVDLSPSTTEPVEVSP